MAVEEPLPPRGAARHEAAHLAAAHDERAAVDVEVERRRCIVAHVVGPRTLPSPEIGFECPEGER